MKIHSLAFLLSCASVFYVQADTVKARSHLFKSIAAGTVSAAYAGMGSYIGYLAYKEFEDPNDFDDLSSLRRISLALLSLFYISYKAGQVSSASFKEYKGAHS